MFKNNVFSANEQDKTNKKNCLSEKMTFRKINSGLKFL